MAFIQVYFDDMLQDEVQLRTDPADPITIGRDPDNDIEIANAGVSGLHAAIWQEGSKFVIADTASKNGVIVNGEITHRRVLEFGDTIELLKYKLKFVEKSAGIEIRRSSKPSTGSVEQKSTVEIDASQLAQLRDKRSRIATARLRVTRTSAPPHEFPLTKVITKIGKAGDCDVRTRGWFARPLAASIVRRSDGYHLKPETGARLHLNGLPVVEPQRLRNGDRFIVRGCEVTFHDDADKHGQRS